MRSRPNADTLQPWPGVRWRARDRYGMFDQKIVRMHDRRLAGFDDAVMSWVWLDVLGGRSRP